MSAHRRDEITVRPAQRGEEAELTQLCMRSKAHWGYDAAFMEAVAGELQVLPDEVAKGRTFVAERPDSAPLGVTVLRRWRDDPATVEVDLCFVDPPAIGTGVGRALWEHMTALARTWGGARLYVESDPNAVAFYEAMGAKLTGELSKPVPPARRLPILVYEV